jgi:hypothetical protein
MIAAVILARNSARTIRYAVESLSWCDALFVYDDHSSDGTADIARKATRRPIIIEPSTFSKPAFEEGELRVRNYALHRAEKALPADALVLLDADEVMDSQLLPFVREVEHGRYSTISCSIFHLFDAGRYIRYRETLKYGIYQIDPHVRIVRRGMRYTNLRAGDDRHPLMPPAPRSLHLHGPFHFHLKYLNRIGLLNTSLEFLPPDLDESALDEFLVSAQFHLPQCIRNPLRALGFLHDREANNDELAVTSCDSSASKRQVCLAVLTGMPHEARAMRRLLELLCSRAWIAQLYIICSRKLSSLVPAPAVALTLDHALAAADKGTHFDLVFQLTDDEQICRAISTLGATVQRGLRLSPTNEIVPANVLAIGYFRGIGHRPNAEQVVRLAMQACELE